MLDIIFDILTVSYLKDKRIRGICWFIGLWGPLLFFFNDNPMFSDDVNLDDFSFSHEIMTAVLWLYTPFLVCALFKWIYTTFFTPKQTPPIQ